VSPWEGPQEGPKSVGQRRDGSEDGHVSLSEQAGLVDAPALRCVLVEAKLEEKLVPAITPAGKAGWVVSPA
jgi:hypothetical protein